MYLNRTGIPWRYLPHDFPPYRTVYGYFAAWSKEGLFTELNYELTGLVRDHHGRQIEPTASIMDTQSVKTSTNVPAVTQGTDAGKKILGRKRGIITDTLGLLRAVIVTAASVSDNVIGMNLLDQATAAHPTGVITTSVRAPGERVRRALGKNRPAGVSGLDADLGSTPACAGPRRVRAALQRRTTAPKP